MSVQSALIQQLKAKTGMKQTLLTVLAIGHSGHHFLKHHLMKQMVHCGHRITDCCSTVLKWLCKMHTKQEMLFRGNGNFPPAYHQPDTNFPDLYFSGRQPEMLMLCCCVIVLHSITVTFKQFYLTYRLPCNTLQISIHF